MIKPLYKELSYSQRSDQRSFKHSVMAGLIAYDNKNLICDSVLEFILSGLRYVFPTQITVQYTKFTYICVSIHQKVMRSPEKLLKLLDEYELDIITPESFNDSTGEDMSDWRSQIYTLEKNGLINGIERNKYCRHNFRNEYVISNYLVDDGVVAYWTALNLHGLTEQFSNTIFVQTTRQKKHKTIFGVRYQFVKIQPEKMMGIITQGYGNHKFRMTNVEKTLVDCFHLPQYSGGYSNLLYALNRAEISSLKLKEAAKAVDNIAVIKRLGYLIELLEVQNMTTFIKFAKVKVNEKYNLLDPQGTDSGSFNQRWRLRINLPEEEILLMSQKTS